MLCSNCGKEGAEVKLVTRSFGKGEKLLLIEDVPIIHCPHCHERYLTAETLHALEEIRRLRRGARERKVEVASFAL
jgi:YgiT-type zinc finger domain-containing protein